MVREAGRSSLSGCNVIENPRIMSPQSACRGADKREIHCWRMREIMRERDNSADAYWTWNEVDRFRAYRSRGDRGNGRNAVFPSARPSARTEFKGEEESAKNRASVTLGFPVSCVGDTNGADPRNESRGRVSVRSRFESCRAKSRSLLREIAMDRDSRSIGIEREDADANAERGNSNERSNASRAFCVPVALLLVREVERGDR